MNPMRQRFTLSRDYRPIAKQEQAAFIASQYLNSENERPFDRIQHSTISSVTNKKENVIEVKINGYVNESMLGDIENLLISNKNAEKLFVRINSEGGSAWAGISIANYLAGLDMNVTTLCESLAASAASLIFMGGDNRLMGEKAGQLLFHKAMGWLDILAWGNVDKLKKVDVNEIKEKRLSWLSALDEDIVSVMTTDTEVTEEQALDFMTKEKMINRSTALKLGLATGTYSKEKDKNEEPKEVEGDSETEEPSEEENVVEHRADNLLDIFNASVPAFA